MAKPNNKTEIEARIHSFKIDGLAKGYFQNMEQLIDDAQFIAGLLTKEELKTHQMRRFYSEIVTINSMDNIDILKKYQMTQLLRPKFAYISAKASGWKPIATVIENSLVAIKSNTVNEDFQMFKDFFEAVLAYHKYNNS